MRLNDTDPTIGYSGFSYSANRGLGDYDNDVHYATANGSTATLTFTGTGIAVLGEQYTDQGNIGVSIDGGTQQTISTLPSDGQRHSNVAVYTVTGLSPGNHTIVVTKLSGNYTTLDGFNITTVSGRAAERHRSDDRLQRVQLLGQPGLGDYDNDVHYATANGSTASLTFTGTGIQVKGEQYTDQGNIGVSIDGGTQQTISTLPSDGQRQRTSPLHRHRADPGQPHHRRHRAVRQLRHPRRLHHHRRLTSPRGRNAGVSATRHRRPCLPRQPGRHGWGG